MPRALAALRRTHPGITVTIREGSTPALVRALRVGTSTPRSWPPTHRSGRSTPLRLFDGEPRRLVLARLPQPLTAPVAHVVDALRVAAAE